MLGFEIAVFLYGYPESDRPKDIKRIKTRLY